MVTDDVLRLSGESDSVPYARRWVADALTGTALEQLVPDAELVVSELVTNALLHAGPPVSLRVRVDGPAVRIEVGDGSRLAPIRALARADAMTGRGLSLVAALARDWGVEPAPDADGGKVVWCELSTLAPVPDDLDEDVDVDALLAAWSDDDDDGVRRYTVELGDIPTDLLLGAKAHVDNLVREFTLAAGGAASGHGAAIPPHLATLIEDVVTGFAEARRSIKKQAVEAASRGDERTRLTLSLPLSAADAGERYVAALDEADAYARAARLLTLETPPQHQVFRRWYVESLVTQLRRAADGLPPTQPPSFERRLLDELAVVATARRNTERAARLQNVTASLAGAATVQDVASIVVSEGVMALGASGGGLVLLNADQHIDVAASVGYDAALVARLRNETDEDELPAAVALRTGENVWLESRQERDERFPELVGMEPGTNAMCAVPLVIEGRALGALRFSFDQPRLFDTDERRFVLTLAGQTAQALGRANAIAEVAAANAKLSFLADASAELASSIDYRTTLANVARLAVPRLADWCAVHIVEGAALPIIAVEHVDPAKVALAQEWGRRYPASLDDPTGVAEVIRSGASQIYEVITDDMLVAGARDEEHLAVMRELGFRSALVVPLETRSGVIGAITLIHAESGRHYDATDLAVAEDLARRSALAIEHATLFRTLAAD